MHHHKEYLKVLKSKSIKPQKKAHLIKETTRLMKVATTSTTPQKECKDHHRIN